MREKMWEIVSQQEIEPSTQKLNSKQSKVKLGEGRSLYAHQIFKQ